MSTMTNPLVRNEPIYRRSAIMTGGSPAHSAHLPAIGAILANLPSVVRPAIEALSARDFKVCENCGGPAMIHPRFEMAQIVSGEKAVLCCSCLHQAANPGKQSYCLGDQLWRCCACGFVRAWGWMQPWDRFLKPALGCGQCGDVTRHRFVRVA